MDATALHAHAISWPFLIGFAVLVLVLGWGSHFLTALDAGGRPLWQFDPLAREPAIDPPDRAHFEASPPFVAALVPVAGHLIARFATGSTLALRSGGST